MTCGSVNCVRSATSADGLVCSHTQRVSVRTLDGEMGILPAAENMIAVLAVDEVKKVKRIDVKDHVVTQ